MPLIGGSIPLGATFAPTGGSATSLVNLGNDRTGVKLLLDDGAEFSLRSQINVSVQEPSINKTYPGGYTPAKRRLVRTKPITLADGSIFVNQFIQEEIVHPETTSAQIDELLSGAACTVADADFSSFWKSGNLT